MRYWLVKSPFRTRSWQDVLIKGTFKLYGIRNHQARNNIKQMQSGDNVLYYHGPSGKQIYGIMQVKNEAYPDPITNAPTWLAIDFEPVKTLDTPITLSQIKALPELQDIGLIKQPRLSVISISKKEFDTLLLTVPGDY